MKAVKRWLYLLHRWFGIAMCLLMALWFVTGIIMMYVEYPELTEAERLALLPALPLAQVKVDAGAVVELLPAGSRRFSTARLGTVLGRPAWQFNGGAGATVFADDGTLLQGIAPVQAEQAVQLSGFAALGGKPRHLALLEMDQWTVSAVLDPQRPLHKVALDDAAGTIVYVSDRSGQIVRDTNRNERFWNWLGSTIHWIYPWQLRRNVDLWAEIVIWLSVAGLVSVVTGGIIGFLRLRVRKPYHGERYTPYRGWQKWHHVLGLASLLFLATFMFSGLMSMGPWGVFANATAAGPALSRYSGGPLGVLGDFPPLDSVPEQSAARPLKEVEWTRLGGEGLLVLAYSANDKELLGSDSPVDEAGMRLRVEAAARSLLPEAGIVGIELLTAYDNYYYSHHNRYRPLPALRVRFDDAEASWFHLDMSTGQALGRLTATDRVARWLYNGLHSLDFRPLFSARPLWDLVVILLCLIGAAFSVTSVWIGWRRLWH